MIGLVLSVTGLEWFARGVWVSHWVLFYITSVCVWDCKYVYMDYSVCIRRLECMLIAMCVEGQCIWNSALVCVTVIGNVQWSGWSHQSMSDFDQWGWWVSVTTVSPSAPTDSVCIYVATRVWVICEMLSSFRRNEAFNPPFSALNELKKKSNWKCCCALKNKSSLS